MKFAFEVVSIVVFSVILLLLITRAEVLVVFGMFGIEVLLFILAFVSAVIVLLKIENELLIFLIIANCLILYFMSNGGCMTLAPMNISLCLGNRERIRKLLIADRQNSPQSKRAAIHRSDQPSRRFL